MNLEAAIIGASVWGPGLEGWAAARPVLAGLAAYQPRAAPPPPPALLPATERRRAGPVIRLALAAAHEAAVASALDPAALRAVFASSNGDGPTVGAILDALATAEGARAVSPTQFHNSVHNAAAGYWSIATRSHLPATCIGCHDESWAAGLLAALAELRATGSAVLLCCYDHPLPPPLDAVRPTGPAFAAALVLAPGRGLAVRFEPEQPTALPSLADPALDELFRTNPSARAIPLLQALCRDEARSHHLPYAGGRLTVRAG